MNNFPLCWPAGWRRTSMNWKKRANFKSEHARVSISDGTRRVIKELRLFGYDQGHAGTHVIVSTNVRPRLDGMPRSNEPEPDDVGVAVYWKKRTDLQHKVMAIDCYSTVADNLAAIAATLHAMRSIERHGGAMILERAFHGFMALPSPNDWRHVLGFDATPTFEEAKARYRSLAMANHSDTGGSDVRMAELNGAWESAQRELLG
jgi:hypothetical protein